MSAHAYTEDQQAQRTLTQPLPAGEEIEQPAIGRLTGLLSGQVTFNSSAASVISKS